MRGNRLVGEFLDEVAFPVLADALGEQAVEGGVDGRIRNRTDELGLDLGDFVEPLELALALLGRRRPNTPRSPRTVSPCRSSGMKGNGGAIWNAGNAPISSVRP